MPIRFETKVRRKDGQIRDTLVRTRPITIDGGICILAQATDITERKLDKKMIKEKQQKLENALTTMQALVSEREKEKKEIGEKVLSKLGQLIGPYFEKLWQTCGDPEQQECLRMIKSNLKEVRAELAGNISARFSKLTSVEAQIVSLIKYNKSTKEIAQAMGLSSSTVDFHRKNIRHKLGLSKKKTSLKKFLLPKDFS